jgi:hypothetical protein
MQSTVREISPVINRLVMALAASARSFDLELLHTIFADMARGPFRNMHNDKFHNAIFRTLCSKVSYRTLLHWLRHLPQWTHGFKPTMEMWIMGLDKCAIEGSAAAANNQTQYMVEMGWYVYPLDP